MGNLGEYQRMTTEAKELGGVDLYKEKYIEMGREDERANREDLENSDLITELIATVAIPIVIYSGTVVYEKVKNLKKEDIKKMQVKVTNNFDKRKESLVTKVQTFKNKYVNNK